VALLLAPAVRARHPAGPEVEAGVGDVGLLPAADVDRGEERELAGRRAHEALAVARRARGADARAEGARADEEPVHVGLDATREERIAVRDRVRVRLVLDRDPVVEDPAA